MKKIYLLLMVIFCFLIFNNDVYALEEWADASCSELEQNGEFDDLEKLIFDSSSYDVNCVYMKTKKSDDKELCLIFKLAFNLDGSFNTGRFNFSSGAIAQYLYSKKGRADAQYYRDRVGRCPVRVGYKQVVGSGMVGMTYDNFYYDTEIGEEIGKYKFREQKIDIPQLIIDGSGSEKSTCADILGEDGINLLKTIKNLIMIFVPILLVGLAVIDIASAMFSGDENNMKKAQGRLVKRVIIAVVIFLIPVVLSFILDIVNMIWPNIDADLCGIF